jgi:MFS family permease
MMTISLGVLVLGSVACALAPSMGALVLARALQGFGAALAGEGDRAARPSPQLNARSIRTSRRSEIELDWLLIINPAETWPVFIQTSLPSPRR